MKRTANFILVLMKAALFISLFVYSPVFASDAVQAKTESENASIVSLFAGLEGLMAKAEANTKVAVADTSGKTGTATEMTLKDVTASASTCETSRKAAYAACASWLSPQIASFMSQYGEMAQMGLMVGGSIGDQCKGVGDMLNKASIVMGLYTAACKSAQSVCKSSCTKASSSGAKFATALKKDQATAAQVVQIASSQGSPEGQRAVASLSTDVTLESAVAQMNKYSSSSLKFCAEFELSTGTAMMGAMQALQGVAKAKQCAEQNSNQADMSVNCQKPGAPGYDSNQCKCARNELSAADCQGINFNPNAINAGNRINAPGGNGPEKNGGSPAGDDVDLGRPTASSSGTGAGGAQGAPGAPVDGGGGALGGGGGGSGGAQDGSAAAKKTNTNVFGGGFGGGGGGGGSGGGSGYGEMDEKLKQYMPGGKLDPNRSIASQLAKEVTPQGGRSNWEKVRLRYRDNYRSLMGK